MLAPGAYLHRTGKRVKTHSLAPHLSRSLEACHTMDASRMREEDRAHCRWVGWGMSKGVTHPFLHISILAQKQDLPRGLHAEMVTEFPGVDPYPLCYDEENHLYGFGSFVRWLHFADPHNPNGPGVLGIDWSLCCRPTSGVATTMRCVCDVVNTLLVHGISPDTEIALLNWRMCEDVWISKWRQTTNLRYAYQWGVNLRDKLAPYGPLCPRCGLSTFKQPRNFCVSCGHGLRNPTHNKEAA